MNLALLINVGLPWSRETVKMLVAQGHTVHVIDFCSAKADPDHLARSDPFQAAEISMMIGDVSGFHYLHTRFKGNLRYLTTAVELRCILHRIRADLLITLYGGGFSVVSWLSGFRPFISWVVGSDVLLAGRISSILQRFALNAAEIVPANGQFLAEQTMKLAPSAKVVPVLLGIDLKKLILKPRLPQAELKVLSNRGFRPVYQNELIVKALCLIQGHADRLSMTFASAGPDLPKVRSMADELLGPQMRAKVVFSGGVSRDRMLELLDDSHVFLSMARSDGTATSLLEAMACGLYPIVSDIPQNREWIRHDWQNGSLVDPNSPDALARALVEAVESHSSGDWQKVIQFNRSQIEERANADDNLRALLSRFQPD